MPKKKNQVDEGNLVQRREAKKVLKELRRHQQKVEDDKQDATDCHSDVLKRHLEQASQNIDKAKSVDQALVDAQTFRRLAEYAGKQAEQLQSGLRVYDASSFIDCLMKNMQGENEDDNDDEDYVNDDDDKESKRVIGSAGDEPQINFMKLGNSVAMNFRTVPSLDFMYGNHPQDAGEKPPVEKKSRQLKKNRNVDRPDELRSDQVEQTETDKQVAAMKKELKKRKSINYWEFVIDPQDFARSVENVFHSSFLIKESWAQLDLKHQPPTLMYRNPHSVGDDGNSNENGNEQGHDVENSEYIMEFDRVLWQSMINKYQIKDCLLPRTGLPRNDHRLQQMYQYDQDKSELATF